MKFSFKNLSILFVLLMTNCSQKQVRFFRAPAAIEKEGCLSLMRGLLKNTRPERQFTKRVDSVRKGLMAQKGTEDFQALVDDIVADAANFEDEVLNQEAISLHSVFTNYSEALARGEKDFTPFNEEFQKVADSFIKARGRVRPLSNSYKNQEHFEMLRFMEKIPQRKVSSVAEKDRINEFILYMTHKQFIFDVSKQDKKEWKSFAYWVIKNPEILNTENKSFDDFYKREFSRFQEAFKKQSKTERGSIERAGKEYMLEQYNQLSQKNIKSTTDITTIKKDAVLLLRLFGDLDNQFEEDRFLSWLFKNDHLSANKFNSLKELATKEDFELKLGDALRQSYREFASFQNVPPFSDKNILGRTKEKVKGLWKGLRKEAPSCDTLDCVSEKSLTGWKKLFQSKFYKDSFSCLAHNPLVLKTMTMDMALVWGALFWHYRGREEEFQRFPYEIIVSGAVFAPVMAEANCRASFKSALPFGATLPKDEVFASLSKKFGRGVKAWRGVALRGFLASAGTLGSTMGFDHLFLAMGHTIAKPLALNDLIILMPLTFLYHGAWSGIKNVAFINPLRHKVLPRLAEYVTRKRGGKMGYLALQTGLDFGAFYALMNFNQWEYLVLYQEKILPILTGSFSAGVTLEHRRELSPEGVNLDNFEGVSESGISSHMTLAEDDEGISLRDGDTDIPKDELEAWADEILNGVKN